MTSASSSGPMDSNETVEDVETGGGSGREKHQGADQCDNTLI